MKLKLSKLGQYILAMTTPLIVHEVTAQEDLTSVEPLQIEIEETVVLGKLRSAAGSITIERMEHESVTDILGADQIARVGDSTVATALRRVPGVTLVNDRFVYVRGLGERYSSVTLNGANVPSPDLTRSVLPLDIFPTFILDSLEVQKGFTPDMPAAFGGGNIDIRTKGIPLERVFSMELGTSFNSEDDDAVTYPGGNDDIWGTDDGTRALSPQIESAFDTYLGDLSDFSIQRRLESFGQDISLAEAQAINSEIATNLNRNMDFSSGSLGQDLSGQIAYGDNFLLDNGIELGFLTGLSYDSVYRNDSTSVREVNAADTQFFDTDRTTHSVNITGNIATGIRLNESNEINASYIYLRNTDDEASISTGFIDNAQFGSGDGIREYDARFEERELEVYQLEGSHAFDDDVRDIVDLDSLEFLSGLEFNWFYSDSEAITDIPGEFGYEQNTTNDVVTGEVISESFQVDSRMLDYRFTDLVDTVESAGYEFRFPIYTDNMEIEIVAGAEGMNKSRSYQQIDIGLGTDRPPAVLAPILGNPISEIFSDENLLDPTYGFEMSAVASESYLAAQTLDAAFAMVDLNWDYTYRAVVGFRWEEFSQATVEWDPLNYQSQINVSSEDDIIFEQADYYPSISLAYMKQDFLGAEDWQLRFSASETVVRPDLREVSSASYRDPLTDFIVTGNPNVVPSELLNLDVRSEWFYGDGDTLTLSMFYKDIESPIELFEAPASDNRRAAIINNAESGEVYGLEVEWLQGLDIIHSGLTPFFVNGNVTLADSELVVDEFLAPTNEKRPLQGASDYVVNLSLGFDSDDGMHAAQLSYNVFGERVFFAGRNGAPDAYEQPFNSVDVTYSWYPTFNMTVKLKAQNLLDEQTEITQNSGGADVTVFERTVGTTLSLDVEFSF